MIKIYLTTILLMFCGSANAVAITSLEITGGYFNMGSGGGSLNPGAYADMTVGGYDGTQPVGGSSDETGYYDTSIATFTFHLFGPAGVYTAESDYMNSGFSAPTGDIHNGNLSLDLSAWTMAWGGYALNQGSSSTLGASDVCVTTVTVTNCSTAITTTYNEMTGEFSASWDAVVIGGTFNSQLGSWYIEGVVTASEVPVPAAVWLFGSGLVGLAAVARRRKAA